MLDWPQEQRDCVHVVYESTLPDIIYGESKQL